LIAKPPSTSAPQTSPPPNEGEGYRSAVAISKRLARAVAHPLRLHILSELNKRDAMSPKQLKETTGATESIQTILKHCRRLEELGCLEEVGKRKSGRHLECLFRPVRRPLFDNEAWESLPRAMKRGVSERAFSTYIERLAQAVEAGTFDARWDRQFTWATYTYDERAWKEMVQAVDALFWCTLESWVEATLRLVDSGEEPIPVTMSLSFIESPPQIGPLDQLQRAPFFLEDAGRLYFDQNLAAGLTHHLRLFILAALHMSPLTATDFHKKYGDMLGVGLPGVAQQFERLEELDCIELVDERRGGRGRPGKIYRRTERSLRDGAQWKEMPESLEAEASALSITTFVEAFADAVRADTVDKRGDSHFPWVGMRLDEKAWTDLAVGAEALFRLSEVLQAESRSRLAQSEEEGVPVIAAVACFESPKESQVSPDATLRKVAREWRPDRNAFKQVLRRVVDEFQEPK
jgi:DNA-binding PadR family transcriptional regulator